MLLSEITLAGSFIDASWYIETQLKNLQHPVDIAAHYVTQGVQDGLDPHPLFSTQWYLANNSDVTKADRNPLAHFLEFGWREGRDPHPLFSTTYYLDHNRDVRESGENPLLHYARFGASEGRQPHPLFDVSWYLERHPEGEKSPLIHFLYHTGRDAHPLFDDEYYLRQNRGHILQDEIPLLHYLSSGHENADPNVLLDGLWYRVNHASTMGNEKNPLIHYVTAGIGLGLNPHPLFDPDWYLGTIDDAPSYRSKALRHCLHVGLPTGKSPHILFDLCAYRAERGKPDQSATDLLQRFRRDTDLPVKSLHPLFDAAHYLSANPDVAAAGINPLVHYLSRGWRERRNPHPLFDTTHYLETNGDVAAAAVEPLSHFLRDGASEERNPHPLFDTRWYLDQHETLRGSGENPLLHYLERGLSEGRMPHPLFDAAWYLARYQDVARSGMDPLTHYILSGAAEGRAPHPPDHNSDVCEVLDIPYEIVKSPVDLAGQDVCLFVTYSSDGSIREHAAHYMHALRQQGLKLVVVVATDGASQAPLDSNWADGVLLRVNHGWDFSAWATAFAVFPELWLSRSLILTNDSVYGPIRNEDLRAIVNRVRNSSQDLIGLTDSYQVCHHLMSYFIVITRSGLASKAVKSFWNTVKSRKNKNDVIKHYELVPIEWWSAQGVNCEIVFETSDHVVPPINPTLVRWRELVGHGFPFMKVQLLRDRLIQADNTGWESALDTNPLLKSIVTRHLASFERSEDVRSTVRTKNPFERAYLNRRRPRPAPKRRFHRNTQFTTFYGATQGMRPTAATDLALEVPFRLSEALSGSLPEKIAVIAHIYYPDMAADILERINNIPVRADLFISTDSPEKRRHIESVFGTYRNGLIVVEIVPNRGRDIGPLLVNYKRVFENYEYFVHVHSKKSPHESALAGWHQYLFDNVLGSPDIVKSILYILSKTDVGIVFPQHFEPVRKLINWGYDYENARRLLAKAGVFIRKDLVLEFPSGSFFWGKSAALKPLIDLNLGWNDFEEEGGQVDGTLAHAIERSILYAAEGAGTGWSKISRSDLTPPETLVPVLDADDLDRALSRVTRPLLPNRIEPIQSQRSIDEVIATATRKCSSTRPRLTLVLPTLHPRHMFGGITTALKVFHDLGSSFDDAVDLRVLCTSVRLDVETMAAFPGYRLLTLGTPDDGLPRTIVDLTDQDAGELPIRRNDVFVATAWWTAHAAASFQTAQRTYHKSEQPLIYLIQDYESDFYARSSRFALCEDTYRKERNQICLINSEELASSIDRQFTPKSAFYVPYKPNAQIVGALKPRPRERIVLVYARPSTPRNGFEAIRDALIFWQQGNPTVSRNWSVVFVGETFDSALAKPIQNLTIEGKLDLIDYADILSRASVGLSLMLSPHPSYPPLEMAQAGLKTITNTWSGKDLRLRSRNIVSPDCLSPQSLAATIEIAVSEAEERIGRITPFSDITAISCSLPMHDPAGLARRLAAAWQSQVVIDRVVQQSHVG